MLTRFRYYFRKKFLDDDVNELQDSIENAIDRNMQDRGLYGLLSELHSVVAGVGFTLDINSGLAAQLEAYSDEGKKVTLPSPGPGFTTPDLSTEFTLPAVGNEKWITLYLRPVKDGSQPEVELKPPVSSIVNFRETEGFELVVVEGVEGVPSQPKPALVAGDVYLADILLTNGITDFTGSTIETNRKRVDPLYDAQARGMDGVTKRLVLSEIATGRVRVRDLEGGDLNLEEGLLATIGAGITLANRAALLSDIAAATSITGSAYYSAGATGAGGPFITNNNFVVPADTSRILVFVGLGRQFQANYIASKGFFVVDVAAGNISGTYYQGNFIGAADQIVNVNAGGSVVIGQNIANVPTTVTAIGVTAATALINFQFSQATAGNPGSEASVLVVGIK